MPKVSIIMNCHNGEKYLREAIDTIYAQTFEDWEIIFFDNVSTDSSAVIAKSYDERLKYIKNDELIPLGAARNKAVLLAEGEWIAFLDTDDRWYPRKLETQLSELKDSSYVACYAGVREVTPEGRKIRDVYPMHLSGRVLEGLLHQFDLNMVTPMFRRDLVEQWGLNFDPLMTASEEYNLFVRIAAKGDLLVQRELLGEYRVSPGSLTDRQIANWAFERRYTLDQLKSENPGIEKQYQRAFREAAARGDYYEARYLMTEGRVSEARSVISKIKNEDLRYRILYYTLLAPFIWNIVHSKHLRLWIINLSKSLLFR